MYASYLLVVLAVFSDVLHNYFDYIVPTTALLGLFLQLSAVWLLSLKGIDRLLSASGALMLVLGFVLKLVDDSKVVCDPHSWLQLTAVFHVLVAASCFCSTRVQYRYFGRRVNGA